MPKTPNKFEAEVRIIIEDIDSFMNHIQSLGATKRFDYSFTDTYYQQPGQAWDPNVQGMRLRVWHQPDDGTFVYYTKNDIINDEGLAFKRSVYPDGKVKLYEGSKDDCHTLLTDLGFEPLVSIYKEKAAVWKLNDYDIVTEYIKELGWTAELEFNGEDPKAVKAALTAQLAELNIDMSAVRSDTVLSLFLQATLD